MKLHKQIKIEAACSKDKYRLTINDPYLYRDEAGDKLIATNGHIIAVVPVECHEGDTGGYVPKACLKDARKAGYVLLNGTADVNGASHTRREAAFPNWKVVIPNYIGQKTIKIGLDSTLLADLASAMGTEGVVLEIPVGPNGDGTERDYTDSITVRPTKTAGCTPYQMDAMGVIMPIKIK